MTVEFTARHFHAPDNLKSYVMNEIKKITKVYDRATHCHVILIHENNQYTTEINLSIPKKIVNVKETTDNITKSIDRAVDKLMNRLSKIKSKRNHH